MVAAQADVGLNPASHKVDEGTYDFVLVQTANYSVSAYEDLAPKRAAPSAKISDCSAPARIQVDPVQVAGSDVNTEEITLTFPEPVCAVATQ